MVVEVVVGAVAEAAVEEGVVVEQAVLVVR